MLAVSWRMCQLSVNKHRDRSAKAVSLPFRVCLLCLGVTDRSKLALGENKNLIYQCWTLSKRYCKKATSIIILGVTIQNTGALAEQEKPTTQYPFLGLAAYNISNFKMLTLNI